ncbi:MAG: hypothetical protein ACTHK4_10155 [Mycobacteriales bacterium]
MSELRVMALDAGLMRRDPGGTAAAVVAAAPDVVAITGAPRYQRWRSKRAAIARRLGMVVATAHRQGGMFLVTTLRATVIDQSFALSSSSAGTSPAVVTATLELRGSRWRVVVAAPGGAPEPPSSDVPAVVVGGVGGPDAIGVDRSLTVVSCERVRMATPPGSRAPMLAVVRR